MKKYISILLCSLTLLMAAGCGSLSNTQKGAMIGGGSGAAIGAAVGGLISKNATGTAIGTAVGTAIGGVAGILIGNKMDKKAEELAKLEDAKVDTTVDANGLKAIKVTFDSGILFDTNKSDLKAPAKKSLTEFAKTMSDMAETDITIWGHTDNTGSDAINEKLSLERAQSVEKYLEGLGIDPSRMITEGKSYSLPVADNSTVEGRALNRRVEVYITANENMIKAAEEGNLQ